MIRRPHPTTRTSRSRRASRQSDRPRPTRRAVVARETGCATPWPRRSQATPRQKRPQGRRPARRRCRRSAGLTGDATHEPPPDGPASVATRGDGHAARRALTPNATSISTSCSASRPTSTTTASASSATTRPRATRRRGHDRVAAAGPRQHAACARVGRASRRGAAHQGSGARRRTAARGARGHGLDQVAAAPGLPFDPNVHEAVVAQKSAEYAEGMISAVLEPGYLLHGRLLRPARVIVAR